MITEIMHIAILVLVYVSCWFVISLLKKRNDVADIAWGLGFVVIACYCFNSYASGSVSLLVYRLTYIWGIRLAIHIAFRSHGKPEDFRYRKWREEWGQFFFIRSYLQVYVLQGCFMLIISMPIIIAGVSPSQAFNGYTYVGFIVWVIGFVFEAVGDYQPYYH